MPHFRVQTLNRLSTSITADASARTTTTMIAITFSHSFLAQILAAGARWHCFGRNLDNGGFHISTLLFLFLGFLVDISSKHNTTSREARLSREITECVIVAIASSHFLACLCFLLLLLLLLHWWRTTTKITPKTIVELSRLRSCSRCTKTTPRIKICILLILRRKDWFWFLFQRHLNDHDTVVLFLLFGHGAMNTHIPLNPIIRQSLSDKISLLSKIVEQQFLFVALNDLRRRAFACAHNHKNRGVVLLRLIVEQCHVEARLFAFFDGQKTALTRHDHMLVALFGERIVGDQIECVALWSRHVLAKVLQILTQGYGRRSCAWIWRLVADNHRNLVELHVPCFVSVVGLSNHRHALLVDL
mmetsp:Transcript_49860/g.83026  ORF Transcript_49860/g.83026 Transcript_49860/m.83026 type:complete len:359 (-) Transcript_49860:277-1353(-)